MDREQPKPRSFSRPGRPPHAPAIHGNVQRYWKGCRCDACRAGHAEHQRRRRERVKTNQADFMVSAEIAREHLAWLQGQGVGKDAVEACTGINYWVIAEIRRGEKLRIRRSTEEKIMRVGPDALSDHAVVDGAETTRRLDELRARGYTMAELAHRLGYEGRNPQLQFYRRRRITAINASRVERLHTLLIRNGVERMLELSSRIA